MRQGKVLTRTIEQETRQHSLLGLDLGDGPPRGQVILGIFAALIWFGVTIPLGLKTGLFNKQLSLFFFLPPMLLTFFGWRKVENNPRRRNITQWVLTVRWLKNGHEPIVALGRHWAHSDAVRFRDRVATRFGEGDLVAVALPSRLHDDKHRQSKVRPRGRRQIPFKPTARLQNAATADAIVAARTRRSDRWG